MAYGKIKADTIVWDNSGSDVDVNVSDIANKAGTASPAFTGTPTAPTAAAGTNTTQIATTAFVEAAAGNKLIEEGSTYRIQFIAIGGGGAGGYDDSGWTGGGGGAGGMAYHDGFMATDGDNYTVTIGSGATGPTSDSTMSGVDGSQAPNGGDTDIVGTNLKVTAYGGGGGAGYNGAYTGGAAGGCGGGSNGTNLAAGTGGMAKARGANGGTSSFGHAGGIGSWGTDRGDGQYAGGGGGGVGGGPLHLRSQGGDATYGFVEWLNATSTGVTTNGLRCIGGGGGGGTYNNSTRPGGGGGGAGDGGSTSNATGGDATDGTGSGGGGKAPYNVAGRAGNGGDGLVIFRYPDNKGQKASGGTVTQSGGWYYHVFTSSGTFTA